jgi:protein-tyrosine phosphatase
MSDYQLKWVTDDVAAGRAPMSYAQLESIKEQGISAIVNLCGEYCDLHQIEDKSGFQVFYLPIPDECAPEVEEMEKALLWMDEILGRNEKVLVHCRFGIGRTGTFLMAYFIRKGLSMNAAEKKMKKTGAVPARYCQWKMLRGYKKKVKNTIGIDQEG